MDAWQVLERFTGKRKERRLSIKFGPRPLWPSWPFCRCLASCTHTPREWGPSEYPRRLMGRMNDSSVWPVGLGRTGLDMMGGRT